VRHALVNQAEETALAYRKSPVVIDGRHPRRGRRSGPAACPAARPVHGGRVMVRPDGYAGLVTDLADTATVSEYAALVGQG
jgi:hypothetical protein